MSLRAVVLSLSSLLITLSLLPAETLSPKRQKEAAKMLKSTDANQRRVAYQALAQMGDPEQGALANLLDEAEQHHRKRLNTGLGKVAAKVAGFEEAHQAWQAHVEKTLEKGRQNLGKDNSAIKQLDSMMVRAQRLHRTLVKEVAPLGPLWKALAEQGRIVQEIRLEAASLAVEGELEGVPLEQLYRESTHGETVAVTHEHWKALQAQLDSAAAAQAFNAKDARWPERPQRALAHRINLDRHALGLPALFLQKQLSAASEGHSEEMKRLSYFSHDSPTPARATPWMRADLADYQDKARGENIYEGNASPDAAYEAWWRSDDHRKIMLMDGANHLGAGLVSKHWTMMMGQGIVPSLVEE